MAVSTFGNQPDPGTDPQINDVIDDMARQVLGTDALHERLVNLEGIDPKLLQIDQARVASTKIIDSQFDPEGIELLKQGERRHVVGQGFPLGELERKLDLAGREGGQKLAAGIEQGQVFAAGRADIEADIKPVGISSICWLRALAAFCINSSVIGMMSPLASACGINRSGLIIPTEG